MGDAYRGQESQCRCGFPSKSERSTAVSRINDLLDLDKIDSGMFNFKMQVHWVKPLIEQVIETCQAYRAELQVTLNYLPIGSDAQVYADSQRLTQVLFNLVSNAIKFTARGTTVEIATEVVGQFMRVSVRDQGHGIPEHFKQRIFKKFSQSDSSDTRQKGGTGLGLAISKALIDGMGGRIDFVSE